MRYFYQKNDQKITQLIYKKYIRNEVISGNTSYRDQLKNEVNCKKKKDAAVNDLSYNQKELMKYFIEQNKCTKKDYYSPYEIAKRPGRVQLNARTGMQFSSPNVDNLRGRIYDSDFGKFIMLRLGLEVEFSLSPGEKNGC